MRKEVVEMPKDFRVKRPSEPVPTIDRDWDETRFVRMAMRFKLLPWYRVSKRKLQHIYRRLMNYLAMVVDSSIMFYRYKDVIDATWPQMRQKLRRNPALAQFMLEYGVYSEFFYPFLLRIPQATTLEIASGYAYDLLGRLREVPQTDALYAFFQGDEMFEWIRLRIFGEQEYLPQAAHVLFIGGGLLQSLRRNDYPLGELDQEIVVYDLNANLREPLLGVFAKPLTEYGIDYHFEPAERAFERPDFQRHFELIDASGVLSYRKNDQQLKTMIMEMSRLLTADGKIVFDLQVLTPTLLFDKMLGWKTNPSMKPELSPIAAIKKVRRICKELGLEVRELHCSEIGVQFVVSLF